MEHSIDLVTQFCIHCGASEVDITNRQFTCTDAVIAISHIRAKKIKDEQARKPLNDICPPDINNDPNTP